MHFELFTLQCRTGSVESVTGSMLFSMLLYCVHLCVGRKHFVRADVGIVRNAHATVIFPKIILLHLRNFVLQQLPCFAYGEDNKIMFLFDKAHNFAKNSIS